MDDATPKIHTLTTLLELAQIGHSATEFSPLSPQCFLLLDTNTKGIAATEQKHLAGWLRQLACPVMGIAGAASGSPIATACDVMLDDAKQAVPLLANIQHSPIAATVLVQLLRATEHMPVPDALVMESMAYATLQGGPEFRRWLDTNRARASDTPADSGPPVVIQRDSRKLTLELNRSSNRNGMSVEMRDGLVEALQLVLTDSAIRSVHISGRGKCFSIGGDLSEFGSTPDPATAHIVRSLSVPGRYLAQCSDRVEVHVHGACVGSGIEFPAFAYQITSAPDAWFQLPEIGFGLIPGAGGCVSIPRRIGRQRTAWLALSGKRIHAQQALDWGLVTRIES